MRSFLGELRRRNVLRAGALYVAGSWALAQGIAQLGPAFGLPDWGTRWFVIACVIGFPFWLAFAWFYEITPEGLKRESEIDPSDSIAHHTGRKLDFAIIGVLAVAVVLLLTDRFVLRHGVNQTVDVPEHSIAVLPFVNRSADKDQEFFSDGISEDMLNLLAKVRELKVISRSSSFSFKGKDVPLKEIAATLGVAYILEGSVQRAGKTLRISAQLIDARNDDNVWSESYDRAFDDVFAIQDEIAGTVVGQLKLKLLGKAQEIDPDVYALFLQARQLARQGTRDGFAQAISLLQQVLAKAPSYVPALVELGGAYSRQGGYALRPVPEALKLSREAFHTALASDPNDAKAHAGLGFLEMQLAGDFPVAARQVAEAVRLDPANADILDTAAVFAHNVGRLDLAIGFLNAAIALDPLRVGLRSNQGLILTHARRYPEAIEAYRTALRLSPEYIGGHVQIGLALLESGDAPAALAEMQKESSEPYRLAYLAIVYHALGRSAESDATLADAIAKYEKEAPENIACVYAYRGEADKAFEWLDKAQAYQDGGLSEIVPEPLFDNIRNDPRWLPLMRKLGKDPETLAKIEFNVALPQDSAAESGAAQTAR